MHNSFMEGRTEECYEWYDIFLDNFSLESTKCVDQNNL